MPTRFSQFRYHLHRGRRAREAGRYAQGVAEARRALAVNSGDPWALALLGQCLHRQPATDLHGARKALEQAWALEPTNGYFVSLLLEVLKDQGDTGACMDLLTWAWWRGAPVERWLPDGPPIAATEATDRATAELEAQTVPAMNVASERRSGAGRRQADRRAAPALAG